jgi:hypothetical protein
MKTGNEIITELLEELEKDYKIIRRGGHFSYDFMYGYKACISDLRIITKEYITIQNLPQPSDYTDNKITMEEDLP